METATPTVTSEAAPAIPGVLTPLPTPTLAERVPKDTEPLRHCADQLLMAAAGNSNLTALELTIELKRAESFLKAAQEALRGLANADFEKLQEEQANKKQWAVYNGAAVVKKTTPRCNWKFPAVIDQLERNLRAAKKAAQEDGTATKLQPTIDPNSSVLFSVTLSENFELG